MRDTIMAMTYAALYLGQSRDLACEGQALERRIRGVPGWLLAGTWVAGQLIANVPAPAWPEASPAMCLTVVARAQVQHEMDEDLDQLADRDDRDPGEGAGSR